MSVSETRIFSVQSTNDGFYVLYELAVFLLNISETPRLKLSEEEVDAAFWVPLNPLMEHGQQIIDPYYVSRNFSREDASVHPSVEVRAALGENHLRKKQRPVLTKPLGANLLLRLRIWQETFPFPVHRQSKDGADIHPDFGA